MKTQNLFAVLSVTAVLLFISPESKATVWRVNNQTAYTNGCSHCFPDLNQAVGSPLVFSGDTIHVEASPSPYTATTINKQLIIIGTGYFLNLNGPLQNNQISSQVTSITFGLGSDGSTITGLWINAGNVTFSNNSISNLTVTRCRIGGVIYFDHNAPHLLNNITITKNYIAGGTANAAGPPGSITGLIMTNNRFGSLALQATYIGTFSQNVIEAGNANFYSGISFYNNIVKTGSLAANDNSATNVYNNIFSFAQPVWLNLSGNNFFGYNMALVFGTGISTDGNLNPLGTCTACPNGYGPTQIGMFGGADPYHLSGIPAIPAIYQLQAPVNTIQADTIHVNISTRSNN